MRKLNYNTVTMGISNYIAFLASNPHKPASEPRPYESSGSRIRRMEYGVMRHDVGYGKPPLHSHPRSHSHSQSHSHSPNQSTHKPGTVTANHRHPAHSAHTSISSSFKTITDQAQAQAPSLRRSTLSPSSYYGSEPSNQRSGSHSRSGSSHARATINPATHYADCTGPGNPWLSTSSTQAPSRPRRRSSSHDQAAQNTLKAHNAKWRARDADGPRWPLRWPSVSISGSERDSQGRRRRPSRRASQRESAWTYDWGSGMSTSRSRMEGRSGSR